VGGEEGRQSWDRVDEVLTGSSNSEIHTPRDGCVLERDTSA
jgi:hypothetical protein